MYIPPLTRINKYILIAYVGLFLLNSILSATAGINLIGVLGLSLNGIKSGLIFQLITFPFIDAHLMNVVFNGLILWFIGSELESNWGERFYLKFLAIVALAPGLLFILLSLFFNESLMIMPLFGLNGLNLGCLVAYGLIYSERTMLFMLIFPMKAKYFTLLLAAVELFMAFSSTASSGVWMHVVSMGIAFVYLKLKSANARGISLSGIFKEQSKKRRKTKLTLVKPEEESDKPDPKKPKYWQ